MEIARLQQLSNPSQLFMIRFNDKKRGSCLSFVRGYKPGNERRRNALTVNPMFADGQIILEILLVNSPKGPQEVPDRRPQSLNGIDVDFPNPIPSSSRAHSLRPWQTVG
jgi:hypothetical protein